MTYTLSKDELRSFLVHYHSLDNPHCFSGKAGIKKLLQRLGSVQYDPLNVVGRNPDLVFQSRIHDYSANLLEELLYKERSLIDGWDKEMSVYLTRDFPYFSRIQQQRIEDGLRILERRGQDGALSFLPQIMDEVKKRGPLAARDIKMGSIQKNRWGHRQISGAAMDYLLTAGELGIYQKKNAQKIYAPMVDLIPASILNAPDPFSSDDDFYEWYVLRRIGSMGAYWPRNGSGWLGYFLDNAALRQKTLQSLEQKKSIAAVRAPEINELFYIRKKDLPLLNGESGYDESIKILAPLDNMIWDRLMVQKVFDFTYSWEVYVPQEKRKYGYYVLPVLYQNILTARFEPVKHEEGKPLIIKNWWWEPSYEKCKTGQRSKIREAVRLGLENFASYLNADGVDKKSLQTVLRAAKL